MNDGSDRTQWIRMLGGNAQRTWTKQDSELPGQLAALLVQPTHSVATANRLIAQLAQQRLAPLANALRATDRQPAVKRLIILPSAALAGVPIELLSDAYTISYAPSGTILRWLQQRGVATGSAQSPLRLLAVADPRFRRREPESSESSSEPEPPAGVLLALVQSGSPAARSGLKEGDVLLKYNHSALVRPADLTSAMAKTAQGQPIPVEVWRAGQTLTLTVSVGMLGIRPDSRPAPEALRSDRAFNRAMRAVGGKGYPPLPFTRHEAGGIARAFRAKDPKAEVVLLLGSEASEQHLEKLSVSGALAKFQYLHFATHGETDNQRLLQSALILAQDQLPDPLEQMLQNKPIYDGRLTAKWILEEWNLNADLVVLSACQTALGRQADAEGYIGFAQALLLAGARSVVLSLWKVDDQATALLMTRFYQNLLGTREGLTRGRPKAEALREAKAWLCALTKRERDRLVAQLPAIAQRGKDVVLPEAAPSPKEQPQRPYEHPYYWAAFILIGDPQ